MTDPFAARTCPIDHADPARAELRAAGPVARVEAPAGGPVWVVTEEATARRLLTDPRVVRDPAFAPHGWEPHVAGREPTAAEQTSVTTLDGAPHAALRHAHATLFPARRMREQSGVAERIARELLTELAGQGTVDLVDGFTTSYPLAVLLELLGAPPEAVPRAAEACRAMYSPDPADRGKAMGAFFEVSAAALYGRPDGLAAELRDRMPPGMGEKETLYALFGLVFAGQLTTDLSIGFLVARLLRRGGPDLTPEDAVDETLRVHPPAPFTLWRFTREEIELGGERIPPRSPVLVDIEGINTDPAREPGSDLAFGAGPHYCIGAQLALMELRVLARVLRSDFPDARLAVPYEELQRVRFPGVGVDGERLTTLPVTLQP